MRGRDVKYVVGCQRIAGSSLQRNSAFNCIYGENYRIAALIVVLHLCREGVGMALEPSLCSYEGLPVQGERETYNIHKNSGPRGEAKERQDIYNIDNKN